MSVFENCSVDCLILLRRCYCVCYDRLGTPFMAVLVVVVVTVAVELAIIQSFRRDIRGLCFSSALE